MVFITLYLTWRCSFDHGLVCPCSVVVSPSAYSAASLITDSPLIMFTACWYSADDCHIDTGFFNYLSILRRSNIVSGRSNKVCQLFIWEWEAKESKLLISLKVLSSILRFSSIWCLLLYLQTYVDKNQIKLFTFKSLRTCLSASKK